jgi:hypothetical protein
MNELRDDDMDGEARLKNQNWVCSRVPFWRGGSSPPQCELWLVDEMADDSVEGFCSFVDDDPTFDPFCDCLYKMCHLHRPDLFEGASMEQIIRCLTEQPGASVMTFRCDAGDSDY